MSHPTIPWSTRIAAVGEGWLPYVALSSAALLFLAAAELPSADDAEAPRQAAVAASIAVPSGPQPAASAATGSLGR